MTPYILNGLRRRVETIDDKIIKLIIVRFRTTNQIQNLKIEFGIPVSQKNREQILLKKYLKGTNRGPLPRKFVEKLFRLIFSYSKKTGIIKRT